ncbi:small nuclear D3-like ribonucleoprotein [Encephalitozoon intestinalis ATCC 50506]|uniref:Small nuclear ribonucleoprotein Sm D3 n=1 Tax=Encephalitozoon intestinalis (strain ATCC 50506) TaxID=876142 RepID=E0S682_ENCIT|nr:small nuclear D3-like ribonucleoprotein [Encephalitozoon intestinalis ATCC 50506]ADM11217.1 small nuclear D3-like ribonucleoprotein [Encephalitozoon intestinalis ATCC 50506]UTX44885.1 small nuclear D3-like ribonucleoprotein [Encephalitozoon intestinalis]
MGVTIPLKLLHEAQGFVVTVETNSGDMYRGQMKEVDDYMNIILTDAVVTSNSSCIPRKEVVIRGSSIRFFVLPPALKFAPFFGRKT